MRTTALALAFVFVALFGATSANASQFRAEQYEAAVSGDLIKDPELKQTVGSFGGSTIKCGPSRMAGSLAGASSSLPVIPVYTKCSLMSATATVSMNSCRYILNSTNESVPYTGTLAVSCTKGGDSIVIDMPSLPCKVTIPDQSAHAQVQYENVGLNRNRGIQTTLAATGIKYTVSGIGCTTAKPGTYENGAISGAYTLRATSGGEAAIRDGLYIANEQIAAGQAKLRAEQYPVTYGGNQKVEIVMGAYTTMQAYMESTASGPAEDLSMTTVLKEGTYSILKPNGCKFVFHLTSDETGTGGVSCETVGAKMVIEHKGISAGCIEEIPAQSGLSGVTFQSLGSGSSRTVSMSLALTNINYTSKGSICERLGTFSNGVFRTVGAMSLVGKTSLGSADGIWLE